MTDPAPDVGIQLHDPRIADALVYASIAHAGQMRKGTGLPYSTHLLAVASSVAEHGGTVEQVVAGLLHDVVEDCGGLPRLADVRARFGDEVARMVEALSDSTAEDRSDKAPWKQRKETYLAELREHAGTGAPYLLVSLADKTHNAESIVADLTDPTGDPGLAVFDRFSAGADQTAWYYRELTAAFGAARRLPARLILRLKLAADVIADHAERALLRDGSEARRLSVETRTNDESSSST